MQAQLDGELQQDVLVILAFSNIILRVSQNQSRLTPSISLLGGNNSEPYELVKELVKEALPTEYDL